MKITDKEEIKRLLGKQEVKIDLDKHHKSLELQYYCCPVHGYKDVVLSKCLACPSTKIGTRMKRFYYGYVGFA